MKLTFKQWLEIQEGKLNANQRRRVKSASSVDTLKAMRGSNKSRVYT